MGIVYDKKMVQLVDFISVEEAEGLLEWLQANPKGKLDLSSCTHLHAANLQVLMAAKPKITAWPKNEEIAFWLKGALYSQQGE